MDIATLLVDIVVGLWVLAVVVALVRAWQARAPRLVTLSPEQVNRFSAGWERVVRRFVNSPREATWEADALVLSLLRERGRSVEPRRLPGNVRTARRWLSREPSEGTEALRQAMLQYQLVFTRMIGGHPQEAAQAGRREMA